MTVSKRDMLEMISELDDETRALGEFIVKKANDEDINPHVLVFALMNVIGSTLKVYDCSVLRAGVTATLQAIIMQEEEQSEGSKLN